MMDSDEIDPFGGLVPYPDDDSGSAYENPESDQSSSHQGRSKAKNSRASSLATSRNRNQSLQSSRHPSEEVVLSSEFDEEDEGDLTSEPTIQDPKIREDAERWAANFTAPQSPSQIPTPERRVPRKRRATKSGTEIRAKRLKGYYNEEYREILNRDIQEASAKLLKEDKDSFNASQLGVSIWAPTEKDLFFSALSRLGRDDIRGIAKRIRTKSETEVHEYIHLLHQGSVEQKDRGQLSFADVPAANQISEECCAVLERAGDALASRQERIEAKVEEGKWGEAWLVTETVSRQLDKYRKDGEGEAEFNQVLPAANLFHLKHWLELSEKVFMNPAAPYENDNWQSLAEHGEKPAIRATAFEDFHSSTVSITKRLVSTVLFCTMSRQRAMSSKKRKYAEVNCDDVEAALDILKMKKDNHSFWTKAARRCHLRVINDESQAENENGPMTYDEVEAALNSSQRPRSRTRSRSRSLSRASHRRRMSAGSSTQADIPSSPSDSDSNSSLLDSDDISVSDSDLDTSSLDASAPETDTSTRGHLKSKKAFQRAQNHYIEALDTTKSKADELELWKILDQTPPFEVKAEAVEEPEGKKLKLQGMSDWRRYTEYWSEWEVFEGGLPEKEAFERNARRMERRRREKSAERKERRRDQELDGNVENSEEDDEDVEDVSDELERDSQGDESEVDEENGAGNEQATVEIDVSEDESSMSDEFHTAFQDEWMAQQSFGSRHVDSSEDE
ncbi:hypothetical protein G7Y89_g1692 [Cudoniella acicularis]|uniref:Myb-like domain-containing protein n=1 Tax=Cudoniella acicularis TaxID=354080 RepID=A0A8H4RWJ7_9HELO|nr:hypothetical protein G7Y89_g1692 [Cudoniella acicularis]